MYEQPEIGFPSIPLFTSWLAGDSGHDMKELPKYLISIINRPWFTRIRAVKEAVLAKNGAILIARDATTKFHHFCILWIALRMYSKDPFVRHSLISGEAIAIIHSLIFAGKELEPTSSTEQEDSNSDIIDNLDKITI